MLTFQHFHFPTLPTGRAQGSGHCIIVQQRDPYFATTLGGHDDLRNSETQAGPQKLSITCSPEEFFERLLDMAVMQALSALILLFVGGLTGT